MQSEDDACRLTHESCFRDRDSPQETSLSLLVRSWSFAASLQSLCRPLTGTAQGLALSYATDEYYAVKQGKRTPEDLASKLVQQSNAQSRLIALAGRPRVGVLVPACSPGCSSTKRSTD